MTSSDVAGREILDSRGNPTVEVEVVLIVGRARPGRRPERRVDRRARGGRAARRRRALRRQGRAERGRVRERRDRRRPRGLRCARPARHRPRAARPRRHRQQGPARRQRDPRHVSSPSPRRPPIEFELPLYRYVGGTNAHVLPVPMMNVINGGVHADNSIDIQEFMIMPVGAPSFARGAAVGHRDVPRAEEGAARPAACRPASATRAASRRPRHRNEDALKLLVEAIEPAGYTPGERDRASPSTRRRASSTATAPTTSRGEGKVLTPRRDRRLSGPASSTATRSSRSRTAWPRTTGTAGRAHRAARRPRASSSATTCSSPTSDGCAGDRARRRQLDPRQGQPDRHRSPRRSTRSSSRRAAVHGGDVAPQRARPKTPRSPTSRSRPTAARSRPAHRPARDRVAKYNQLLRIEADLGESAAFRGRSALARGADTASPDADSTVDGARCQTPSAVSDTGG